MKIKRGIQAVFIAVMFIPLTCAGGFAETDVGTNYSLGGYISLGGGWLSDQPRHMNRDYLKKYVAFPQGFLAETDLSLESKEGLDYYRFLMSNPGLTGAQDYLVQVGKIGVFHAQIEYDELQNIYCTVNPFINSRSLGRTGGILVQRLRFIGYFSPTPALTIFAENQFLRRTGWQPASNNTGPGNPYNFTTFLRPINYNQNDMKIGAEYDQPNFQKNDEHYNFQGRVSYHLSTFENAQADVLGRFPPVGAVAFDSLPPSNMANYITAEGALNLKSYLTRITSSFSYGWLSQSDFVFDSTTAAGPPARVAGRFEGLAGLGATTVAADISGVTRPISPLTLRYSYHAYNFDNNDTNNRILANAFNNFSATTVLRPLEQYSYLRQTAKFGVDYRVNPMLAFTLGYSWQGTNRTNDQGDTSSHSPQVGIRLAPTNWLSLNVNYANVTRIGSKFRTAEQEGEAGVPLTYKTYSGNLNRNTFNFIAEVNPVNNVSCSANFSIYNDDFTSSEFGLRNDQGWSTGVDVSWRPHDRVALSLGYDHQQLQNKAQTPPFLINGEASATFGDLGPDLRSNESYDTFIARADFKLIPKKLMLTTRGSYSFASSNFHNSFIPNLNQFYGDIRTFFTYQFNDHWACRAGYIFEAFGTSNKRYQTLYVRGVTAAGAAGNDQRFNTLDGFYRNATAHILQGFLQYKF